MVKALFDVDQPTATVSPVVASAVNANVPAISTPTSNLPALVNISDDVIDKLGDASTTQLSSFSQQMLTSVRASDADVFGSKLNELVGVAKGMNPANFKGGGLLAKVSNLFGSVKEKMLAQYSTVEKRMDALVAELDQAVVLHTRRVTDLEGMYTTNYQAHQALEVAVGQGTDLQAQLEAGLAQMKAAPNPDSFAAQKMADLDNKIQRLEKRCDDLKRAMLLAKQTAPEIRLLQDNSRTLASKFKDVKAVTIPAWKNAFTLYLVQLEQKKGAELATAVADATDAAFVAQADMLRSNATLIAQAKQRSVVSIETLEHVQQQLIGSFDDMQKIADDGRKARKDAEPKLLALEQELITRFVPKN